MDGMSETEQDSAVASEAIGKFMNEEFKRSFEPICIEGDGRPERRWVIVSMRCSCLIDVFNWFLNPDDDTIVIPYESVGFPADCRVVRVFYNAERDCIDLVVSHDSFDVVPEACITPRLSNASHFRTLARRIDVKPREIDPHFYTMNMASEDAS